MCNDCSIILMAEIPNPFHGTLITLYDPAVLIFSPHTSIIIYSFNTFWFPTLPLKLKLDPSWKYIYYLSCLTNYLQPLVCTKLSFMCFNMSIFSKVVFQFISIKDMKYYVIHLVMLIGIQCFNFVVSFLMVFNVQMSCASLLKIFVLSIIDSSNIIHTFIQGGVG